MESPPFLGERAKPAAKLARLLASHPSCKKWVSLPSFLPFIFPRALSPGVKMPTKAAKGTEGADSVSEITRGEADLGCRINGGDQNN